MFAIRSVDYPTSMSPNKKRKNDNRIKVRKKMKNPLVLTTTTMATTIAATTVTMTTTAATTTTTTTNNGPQPPRQRIDLKGPRVKHVCRSASVALGQPIATFPSPDGKDVDPQAAKVLPKTQKEDDRSDKKYDPPKDKENNSQKSNQDNSCNSNANSNVVQVSCGKRTKSQQNVLAPSHQLVSVY